MEILFLLLLGPAAPFIKVPELAFIPLGGFGLLLLWLYRTGRPGHGFNRALCLFSMLVWGLFYWNEQNARTHQHNIRVDLLILWPVVLLTSLLTVISAWLTHTRPASSPPTE